MPHSRRTFLSLAVTSMASTAGGLLWPPSSSSSDSEEWVLDELARTRAATGAELAALRSDMREAALQAGYPAALIDAGSATATMSVNPRGNDVGKIALVLSGSAVAWLTKESRASGDRVALAAAWVDGEHAGGMVPSDQAAMLAAAVTADGTVAPTAAQSCCSHLGAPGTCCQYDLQGLFECCAPCALSLPISPAFLACAIVWCQYCATSHCQRWYTPC